MNLIEHKIIEVHEVEDVTEQFERRVGIKPHEPLYQVDLTFDCYGQTSRGKLYFFKKEWDMAIYKRCFLA